MNTSWIVYIWLKKNIKYFENKPYMAINYRNINLPEKVIEQIDEIVEIKELGYSSRADFVKDAIRKSVQELMKSGVIKKKSTLIRVD